MLHDVSSLGFILKNVSGSSDVCPHYFTCCTRELVFIIFSFELSEK